LSLISAPASLFRSFINCHSHAVRNEKRDTPERMSPDHSEIDAAARKHSTQGREMLPRFHPACFPWKTILIHVMITESPCPIKAARRWSSVMSRIRILSPCGSLSLDAQTAYCPLQRFLHRLFYRREPACVKPDSS